MKQLLAIIIPLFFTLSASRGRSIVDPSSEGGTTSILAKRFQFYYLVHGKEPTDWNQIDNGFVTPINLLCSEIQPTNRYAFVQPPLSIPGTDQRVVMISRSPCHDENKMEGIWCSISETLTSTLKRNVIVLWGSNNIGVLRISEHHVQKLFANAQVPLPQADSLGLRHYEIGNYIKLTLWTIVLTAIFGKILLSVFRWMCRDVEPLTNRSSGTAAKRSG